MTEKPHTPDSPRKPDLRAFGQAVRFRDQATRAAVAHHERCGLPPSTHYARVTFDAIAGLIREDERARLTAEGWQPPEPPERTDETRHIIEVLRDGSWTIRHPRSCELAEFGCRVSDAAEESVGLPSVAGRYPCWVDSTDGRLRVTDRLEG